MLICAARWAGKMLASVATTAAMRNHPTIPAGSSVTDSERPSKISPSAHANSRVVGMLSGIAFYPNHTVSQRGMGAGRGP